MKNIDIVSFKVLRYGFVVLLQWYLPIDSISYKDKYLFMGTRRTVYVARFKWATYLV